MRYDTYIKIGQTRDVTRFITNIESLRREYKCKSLVREHIIDSDNGIYLFTTNNSLEI